MRGFVQKLMDHRREWRLHAKAQLIAQTPFSAFILWCGETPYLSFGVIGAGVGCLGIINYKERQENREKLAQMKADELHALRTDIWSLGYEILGQYLHLDDSADAQKQKPAVNMADLSPFEAELIDPFLLDASAAAEKAVWGYGPKVGRIDSVDYDAYPELHEAAAGIASAIGFMSATKQPFVETDSYDES